MVWRPYLVIFWNESPLRGAPVGIKPQGKPWTRNSVSDPAASGEVFDTNKDFLMFLFNLSGYDN